MLARLEELVHSSALEAEVSRFESEAGHHAKMAKLVDAANLKFAVFGREGSNPSFGTMGEYASGSKHLVCKTSA